MFHPANMLTKLYSDEKRKLNDKNLKKDIALNVVE